MSVCRVLKRRVQRSPRQCRVRVKAFDEEDIGWRHLVLKVPQMVGPVPDYPGLALEITLDYVGSNEVRVWNGARVGHRDGVLEDSLDRPPDIDDLIAPLEQVRSLFGELPS